MYKHVVFWKIKEEANGIGKASLVQSVTAKLNALPLAIPEIKAYEVAENIGDYDASFYDVCLISVFDDRASFWKYTQYPKHDEVLAYIQAVQLDEQIVDFEE
jgi:hypothetical protein